MKPLIRQADWMTSPQQDIENALALHRGDQIDQAERIYRDILQREPVRVDAMLMLGIIQLQRGEADKALGTFDQALTIAPDSPDAYCDRGHALRELRRFEEALADYGRAVSCKPDHLEALYHRAKLLQDLHRFEQAIVAYDEMLAVKPDAVQALQNRGAAHYALGHLDEALRCYDRALAADSESSSAWYYRGGVLLELERIQEARASFDRAVELNPDSVRVRNARGRLKLLTGDFATGWEDYEVGQRRHGVGHDDRIPFWAGEQPRGRSVLVSAAQDARDTIQFSRYLPMLAARGASVVFFCPQDLVRIFSGLGPRIHVVAQPPQKQRFDYLCRIRSLPYLMGADGKSIPPNLPFIRVEPERIERWRARIGAQGFRIGICWRGAPDGHYDGGRSPPLAALLPIARLPGVRLISLQNGHGLEQLQTLPTGMQVETLGVEFENSGDALLDTAAVMDSLDLVIGIDSAITHLAGAMDMPVWIALQRVPDWRWQLERSDSPWYPSARLFRQPSRGDWNSVYAAMAAELTRWLARRYAHDLTRK